jgi:hypothetical protein
MSISFSTLCPLVRTISFTAKLGAVWVDAMASGKFLGHVTHAVDVGLQTVRQRLQTDL